MLGWVVGAGGLLGAHVRDALATESSEVVVWDSGEQRICWSDPPRALSELAILVERFSRDVISGNRSWSVVWCAGAGVVGTNAQALDTETSFLEHLLILLRKYVSGTPGTFVLASSAGGVYGENPEQPLTEHSICMPVSDYGRNKLRQENMVSQWARGLPNVSTLVARISNLYGPGQNMNKSQGLIAHISRNLLHRSPINIYVPLDTLRDYIFVTDCAAYLVRCLDRLCRLSRTNIVKIFNSGETVTVGGVIAAFARIAKGQPRIICSSVPNRSLQPIRLQLRSDVWSDLRGPRTTNLSIGILRVHQHMQSLFQQGQLPRARSL